MAILNEMKCTELNKILRLRHNREAPLPQRGVVFHDSAYLPNLRASSSMGVQHKYILPANSQHPDPFSKPSTIDATKASFYTR